MVGTRTVTLMRGLPLGGGRLRCRTVVRASGRAGRCEDARWPRRRNASRDGRIVAVGPTVRYRCASRVFSPSPVLSSDGLGVGVEPARRRAACAAPRRSRRRRSRRRSPRSAASSRMPSTISSSVTSAIAPPVRRADVERVRAVGRVADGQRLGDGVRPDRAGRRPGRPRTPATPASSRWPGPRTPCTASPRPARATPARGRPCRPWSAASPTRSGTTTWSRQPPAELLGDLVARRSWSPRRSTGRRLTLTKPQSVAARRRPREHSRLTSS